MSRHRLNHDTPNWVPDAAVFFVTVCAANRCASPLTTDDTPETIIGAAKHYHEIGRSYCHLIVVMPDHIHTLISYPRQEALTDLITEFKAYTAKRGSFRWQRNFFDHRLRSEDSFDENAHYLRMNPVRANLCTTPEAWPHTWTPDTNTQR